MVLFFDKKVREKVIAESKAKHEKKRKEKGLGAKTEAAVEGNVEVAVGTNMAAGSADPAAEETKGEQETKPVAEADAEAVEEEKTEGLSKS